MIDPILTHTGVRSSSRLGVSSATLVNLLEDEKESLQLRYVPALAGSNEKDIILDLPFRGFQIHTVKLTVEVKSDV